MIVSIVKRVAGTDARSVKNERDNNRATTYGRKYVVYPYRFLYNDMDVDDNNMRWTPYWLVTYEEFTYGWLQIFIASAIWGI